MKVKAPFQFSYWRRMQDGRFYSILCNSRGWMLGRIDKANIYELPRFWPIPRPTKHLGNPEGSRTP